MSRHGIFLAVIELTALGAALLAGAIPARAIAAGATPAQVTAHDGVTSVRIHLVALGDHGVSGRRIGCGDSLIAVLQRIPATKAPLSAAMRLQLKSHDRFYGESGLYNALYRSRLSLERAVVNEGRATIHLAGKLRFNGVCDAPRIRAQLRQTALQFRTVQAVSLFINDVPLWKQLSMK